MRMREWYHPRIWRARFFMPRHFLVLVINCYYYYYYGVEKNVTDRLCRSTGCGVNVSNPCFIVAWVESAWQFQVALGMLMLKGLARDKMSEPPELATSSRTV